jgi:hypothetical protein
MAFGKGDRVQLNADGVKLDPAGKRGHGTVRGPSRGVFAAGCYIVKWDNLKTPASISGGFIRREDPQSG